MLFKRLYKLNSDGKTVQLWEVHQENDTYYTVSGQLDGKKVTSAPTTVVSKVKRTLEQQLELEMNSLIKKKRDRKYVDELDDVSEADAALGGYSAMLAKDWNKHKNKVEFPCAIQPKLDGVRCLITKEGMFSRNRQQYTSCKHIWDALQPLFKKDPDLHLDGELYAHEFKNDFEEIISAARKSADKATPEDIERQKKLSFYVYDAPVIDHLNQKDPFIDRFNALTLLIKDDTYIKPLQTEFNIASEKDIDHWHNVFIEEGFEGAIVRNTQMPYEGKRTHNLLKVKNFQDAEYEIIGVNEGVGNLVGRAGTFTVRMDDGQTFNAKLVGKVERLKWIFENPQEVIGKMVTVRYQNLTKYGIPRFPVAKAVRGLKDHSDWL